MRAKDYLLEFDPSLKREDVESMTCFGGKFLLYMMEKYAENRNNKNYQKDLSLYMKNVFEISPTEMQMEYMKAIIIGMERI